MSSLNCFAFFPSSYQSSRRSLPFPPRHRAREPEDGLRRRERPGVGDVIGRGAVSHRRLPAEPRPPADLNGGEPRRRRLATPVTSQQLNITTPVIIIPPVSERVVKFHQRRVSRGSRLSQMEAAILKRVHAGPRRTRSRMSTDLLELQTFSVLFPATVRVCSVVPRRTLCNRGNDEDGESVVLWRVSTLSQPALRNNSSLSWIQKPLGPVFAHQGHRVHSQPGGLAPPAGGEPCAIPR